MATFPQGMTIVDRRCAGGERKVFLALKRCLDDDFIVWHNTPIGHKARQPDFVILSPRWGILLLEVKDWKPATLRSANHIQVELDTDRGRVTEHHPLLQARTYAQELVDLMQRDPALVQSHGPHRGKLLFPYGWGCVLSGIRRQDIPSHDFDEIFPSHQTLLRDDLADELPAGQFLQRLAGMFTVHFPHTLTLPQRDRIRWHLFPEIRVATAQAALDLEPGKIDIPDLMQVMDLQQEQIARSLGEGHRVIHGSAGSGKTMILVYRAEQLAAAARPDKPILVTCYNKALASRIEAQLRARGVDERVVVRTFHSWCEELVTTYQLKVPAKRGDDNYFLELAEATTRAVATGLMPGGQYMALLIDEAHDFEDAWLTMAASMVDPATNSLLVLYDDAQSIYQKKRRKFSFSALGIEARGRTSILKLNYRNTTEVLSLAMACADALLNDAGDADAEIQTVKPQTAGRRGPLPVLIEARNARQEADLLAQRVADAIARGNKPGDIAILYRTKYVLDPITDALKRQKIAFQLAKDVRLRGFDWNGPSVKLVTLHSSKGLEFPIVFVAGLQALPCAGEPIEEEVRLLYVGMTRANQELVLSAHGDSPIVQRVREALAQTARQLAAA